MSSTAISDVMGRRISARRRGQLAVAIGAIAWSSAGVLQRELNVDVAGQLAGRAFFAMLALLAFTAATHGWQLVAPFRAMGRDGIAVAVCMAIASGAFIVALNHTTVAHVLFIQAASPMMAGLLAWIALGERLSRSSAIAMVVALMGVAVMVGDPRGGSLLGDAISIVMALTFAIALVITRHRRDISMAPATCLAQLFILLCAAPFVTLSQVTGQDLWLLIALGVFQMGVGLAFLTVGARLIPAAEVALITLLEVVLGPLWVLISIGERPDTATLAGGAVVILAVVVQALGEPRLRRTEPAATP